MTDFFERIEKKGKTSPVMKYLAFTYSTLYYLTLVLCQKQFGEKYQASGGQFWKFSKFVVYRSREKCPMLAVFLFPTQGFKRERCKEQRPKNDERTLLYLLETGQRPLTR